MKKTEGIFQIRKTNFRLSVKRCNLNSIGHRQRLKDLDDAKHTKHSDIKCAQIKIESMKKNTCSTNEARAIIHSFD